MKTLVETVWDQVLSEWPQIENENDRVRFVDVTINAMSNIELLERISDAYSQVNRAGGENE